MDTLSEATPAKDSRRFPLNVRIAAFYIIALALLGLVGPFFDSSTPYPKVDTQSLTDRIGWWAPEYAMNILYLVSGIYILRGHSWARKLAIGALAFIIPYGARVVAWTAAEGQPSKRILLISYGIVGVWNGLWIFLLWWKAERRHDSSPNGSNGQLG